MSTLSSDQLKEIISRVTSEVQKEVGANLQTFAVSDFHNSVEGLGKAVSNAAWTITYSTNSLADIAAARDPLAVSRNAAWTISYSTNSLNLVEKTQQR